ncbi:MAG TPA: hypothetical protein VF039_14410 [Longimicrobiales bacterium]
MIRRPAAPLALMLFAAACGARAGTDTGPRADYRMSLAETGDTAWFHLQNEATIGVVANGTDTVVVRSSEDYVLELARSGPDTLVGFFDHIRIMTERAGRVVPVPMEPLYRREFLLTDSAGRYAVRALPHVSQMEPSVREAARLLDETFFTVPAAPLAAGLVWVDTVDTSYELNNARFHRMYVTRYQVVGDTVLHGVQAAVIRYESALDNEAAQIDNADARTVLAGTETGTIVYSPARALILSSHRNGRLDGEMTMPGPNGPQRMSHFYEFAVGFDLLPPRSALPADTAEPAPTPRRQD